MVCHPTSIGAFALAVMAVGLLTAAKDPLPRPIMKADGTLQVPAFELPPSDLLTVEERDAFKQRRLLKAVVLDCLEAGEFSAQRDCIETRFEAPLVAKQKSRYEVRIQPEAISGVRTQIVTPAAGVTVLNQTRVLINLHGGAFVFGARYTGQIESIPIAALGRIKVVSVDYRLAPEHTFPAASEDVVSVYRALLKDYKAQNIGIYGCSAGGVLTAQAVAWIQKEKLPRPGAVGMFCAAASFWSEGDSGHLSAAMEGGTAVGSSQNSSYFKGTNPGDPLAFPIRSQEILAKFPPSLLISSTRDLALSSVVRTHSQLTRLGVEADLHVWEGVDHAFFYDADLPQSREVYDVVVKFFDKHLGRN